MFFVCREEKRQTEYSVKRSYDLEEVHIRNDIILCIIYNISNKGLTILAKIYNMSLYRLSN